MSKIKAYFVYEKLGNGGPIEGRGPYDLTLEKEVESKRIVCDRCNGDGTHVNPNIDGNGITADEMDELGEDFRENYIKGFYDIKCLDCKGERVLDVVDVDLLSIEDKKAYWEYIDEVNAAKAEAEYERRMGC